MTDTVLVQVLPNAHLAECRVTGVEDLITIGVQAAQRLESRVGVALISHRRGAAGRCFGDRDLRIDAKQLAPGIDHAIAIAIQHQPAVVALEPAGAGANTVGIVIEHDRRGADADRFDTVRIQVNGQGITRREHMQLGPDGGQCGIDVDALVAVQRWVGIDRVEHDQLWRACRANRLDPSRQTELRRPADDAQLFARGLDVQDEVIATAQQVQIASTDVEQLHVVGGCIGGALGLPQRVIALPSTPAVGVIARPANQGVIARSTVKHVVASAAFQHIVAAQALKQVGASVAQQAVGAAIAGAVQIVGAAELQVFKVRVEFVINERNDLVNALISGLRSHIAQIANPVGIVARASGHLIGAVTAVELVVSLLADQRVVSRASNQQVIACTAQQQVVAVIAIQMVVAVTAADLVGACAAKRNVVAALAIDRVVTRPADDAVVTITGLHTVVASVAINQIVARTTQQLVVVSTAVEQIDGD